MFHRISLRLAPTPQCPKGCDKCGYEIIAPLDRNGMLDAEELKDKEGLCTVEHFAPGEARRSGRLVHRPGRARRPGMWAFDYGTGGCGDDEDVYGLERIVFEPDAIVSLRDCHGAFQPFTVVRFEPLALHEHGFRDSPRSDC
jgi:hypothetical protein